MKQLLHGIPVVIAAFMMSQPADAYDFIVDNLYYDIIDSETCRISGYDTYSDLTELEIPPTVEYRDYYGNPQTYKVVEIAEGAFKHENYYGESKLKKVTLPYTVSRIPAYAFQGCTALETVEVKYEYDGSKVYYNSGYVYSPELISAIGIESIGAHAFDGCTSLTDYYPACNAISTNGYNLWEDISRRHLDSIGEYAFYKCSSLVEVSDMWKYFGPTTLGAYAFAECENLATVNLNLVEIPEYAFYNDKLLRRLPADENTISIGDYAFYECPMYEFTLSYCTNLKSIGNYAFNGISPTKFYDSYSGDYIDTRNVVIPESVTFIGAGAFSNLHPWDSEPGTILSVTFLNKLTEIPDGLFENRNLLNKVTFSDASPLTKVGQSAFRNCHLEDFDFSHLESIGENAFYGCPLNDVKLPESLKILGNYAFSNCSKLRTVNVPEGITTLHGTFMNCDSLSNVSLPSTLTDIDSKTFSGCTNLLSIELPDGLNDIGQEAFESSGIITIEIPKSVKSIGSYAFSSCLSLKRIDIPEGITTLISTFKECDSLSNVSLPSTLLVIGGSTFSGCKNLTTIELPAGLNEIDRGAFESSGIITIEIPKSVKSIGSYAFRSCPSLTQIVIPEGIETLENELFYGSTKLKTVSLPSTLTQIKNRVFEECRALEKIKIKAATPPKSDRQTFLYVDKNACIVYVPEGCVSAYKAAAYWKGFKYIYEDEVGLITDNEWNVVARLKDELISRGYDCVWNVSGESDNVTSISEISFENHHIVQVDLSNKNLSGEIPWTVLEFPYLRVLNLSRNSLTGEPGTALAAKLAEGSVKVDSLRVLNISYNQFNGNLATLANSCPRLSSLSASYNCFSDIYPAMQKDLTDLYYSNQTIDRTVNLDLANLNLTELLAQYPTILCYSHSSRSWNPSFYVNASTSDEDPDKFFQTEIRLNNGGLTFTPKSTNCNYYGQSGDTLNMTSLESGGYGSTFKMRLLFASGDVNFSATVNIGDVQSIINKIKGVNNSKAFNFTAADLYTDGVITVQDVVKEVDLLMSQSEPSSAAMHAPAFGAELAESEAELSFTGNDIIVCSSEPVGSFDIYIEGADAFELSPVLTELGMVSTVRKDPAGLRVVGYTLDDANIEGTMQIGTVSGRNLYVNRADLATADARLLQTAINNIPTGVSTVSAVSGIKAVTCAEGIRVSSADEKQLDWIVTAIDGRLLSSGVLEFTDGNAAIIPVDTAGICIVSLRGEKESLTFKINLNK